jgi:hypothetical protein
MRKIQNTNRNDRKLIVNEFTPKQARRRISLPDLLSIRTSVPANAIDLQGAATRVKNIVKGMLT